MNTAPIVRSAGPADAGPIHDLLDRWAARRILLPRPQEEIRRAIDRFLVAEMEGTVVGCAAVEPYDDGLAEIRSVAVAERSRGGGIGSALMDEALAHCRRHEVARVFVLTYATGFFRQFGFREVSKGIFPHKVWTDCIRCPHYYNCDEEAMLLELDGATQ